MDHYCHLNLCNHEKAYFSTVYGIIYCLLKSYEGRLIKVNGYHNHTCRPTHGTARKRHRTLTITRHQKDN